MNADSIVSEISELLQNLLAGMALLVPRLILSLIIILIGLLVARVAQKLITQFILYLDRNLNARLRSRLLSVDLQRSAQFIGKTFFWIILLFTLAVVTQILGLPILTTWFGALLQYLPNILAAIVIIFAGIIGGKLLGDLIGTAVSRAGITNGKYLSRLVQYMILFIAIVIAVDQLGIDIVFLTNLVIIVVAALLFGAALAFGLGARTAVSNILGSYYVQKTYQEGNVIQIGEVEGIIVKITPTTVIVKTKSGQVTIPAKDFNEERSLLIKEN